MANKRKYFPIESELQIIRDLYDGTTVKTNIIMMRLGRKYPRWHVKRLAQSMGLARLSKMPNWSEKEEQYLEDNYHHKGYVSIRNGLMRINGGVSRSLTAMKLKAKRLQINKGSEGYTLRGVEALLGIDHHKIERWIDARWLAGKRRGTLRKKSQGGDMWFFHPEDLRTFIINHPDEIDLRRVAKQEFIALLAGEKETLITCICPRCGEEHELYLNWKGPSIPRKLCAECRADNVDYIENSPRTSAEKTLIVLATS
ncbi:MAG: hypothetical protein JRC60_07925 [Deltaproteobacteria bacterium]|nr:hypothetical protein [Deltaproteobacteria bacterium]